MEQPLISLPKHAIFFDTEYTAWEGSQERGWSGPGEYREIVEIGAVLIDGETLDELGTWKAFVRPVKNPELSKYFTDLTGITQEMIEREGGDYPTALARFAGFCRDYPIYCWGHDGERLADNATLLGIPFPFEGMRFRDARKIFQTAGIAVDQYMSSTIIRAFGNESGRRGHDALHDALTIIDALRELKAGTPIVAAHTESR